MKNAKKIKMKKFGIRFEANLVGLKNVEPMAPFTYLLKLKCEHCGETHKNLSWLNEGSIVRTPKGTMHLDQKCKDCTKKGYIKMMKSTSYLMEFECHDWKPIDVEFAGLWKAETTAGEVIKGVEVFSGEEESDEDDKGNEDDDGNEDDEGNDYSITEVRFNIIQI